MYGNVVVRRRIVAGGPRHGRAGTCVRFRRGRRASPSRSASSTPTTASRRSPCPTATACSWRRRRSTPRAACWAAASIEIVFRDDGGDAGRCGARGRGAADARERLLPRRHLPLQRRPRGGRLRQPEEDAVPRHRAADRRHHHGAGQPLHLPRAALAPTCRPRCWSRPSRPRASKKWAIVAPNYEYGQSAAANFKKLIKIATPDAEIVGEQFPALGKIDAGATVAALETRQARRHLQRDVRRRPHRVRARGQHARPVREAHRGRAC